MNKEDALRQLLNYLAMIDAHDDFTPELLALIAAAVQKRMYSGSW